MMLAGLTLSTTVTCSEVNLFFNTSFDSEQYILKHLLNCVTVVRTCKTSLTIAKKFANFTSCVQFSYKVQFVMRCFTERVT